MFKIKNYLNTLNRDNLKKNEPKYIILHSTNSYETFEDLLNFHKNINKWNGVGYHYFIDKNGRINQARNLNLEGAHCLGFNFNSIGICIYSRNDKISNLNIRNSKNLIKYLKNNNQNNLKVLSHTEAQIEFINNQLKKYGFEKNFYYDENILKKVNFLKLKKEVNDFILNLNSDKYLELKLSLKSLKNCPGEIYYKLK